jgi:hypothetical protein
MSPEADTILEESKLNFTFKIASEWPSRDEEILVMGLTWKIFYG